MPLSHEYRRRDKDYITANRIPKLYLTDELLEEIRKRYPNIRVSTYRGRPYVDIRDFKSCSFIRSEAEKRSRELYAFCLLRFLKWKKALPDDLIEVYRRDPEAAARDIAAFISDIRGLVSEKYLETIIYAVGTWLFVNSVEFLERF